MGADLQGVIDVICSHLGRQGAALWRELKGRDLTGAARPGQANRRQADGARAVHGNIVAGTESAAPLEHAIVGHAGWLAQGA